jgi:hypothetical protein
MKPFQDLPNGKSVQPTASLHPVALEHKDVRGRLISIMIAYLHTDRRSILDLSSKAVNICRAEPFGTCLAIMPHHWLSRCRRVQRGERGVGHVLVMCVSCAV